MITKDYLKSLRPCEYRYEHYLTYYKDWSGSLDEFLDLPELTHEDKRWVFVRSISKDKLRLVAADFAERVLHIYESKYPNDYRPRKAIEEVRSGKDIAAASYTVDDVAAAASYTVDDVAASSYAASYAAADAADAAVAAAASVAVAVAVASVAAADASVAAADAADAAVAAAADRLNEEKAQLEIMKKYAREALKGE